METPENSLAGISALKTKGFDSIPGNDVAKKFLKNEIKKNKDSGTYLFEGEKGINLTQFAIGFAKALNCPNVKDGDFCGICNTCDRIDKLVHPDIEMLGADEEVIKIERIRKVISDSVTSSYEKGRKVFIIKDIDRLRKESANALLKTIEEPSSNTYFILLANNTNILPTIISRSIRIRFFPQSYEKIGIDSKVFEFMMGNIEDCISISNVEYNIEDKLDYREIGVCIEKYLESKNIVDKANIIKCIEDFCTRLKFLTEIERIVFAEKIEKSAGNDRLFIRELLKIFIIKTKNYKNLEKILEIKESMNYNISISLSLYNFFLNL